MYFQELVLSLLAEKEEKVSEFPMEIKANGYMGIIYKYIFNTGKNKGRSSFDPCIRSYLPIIPKFISLGKVSTLEAAKTKIIDYLNSLPALLDTPFPESEDSIAFPFNIYKDGKRVGRINRHRLNKYYTAVRDDIKRPGTNDALQVNFGSLKKALNYAFGIKEEESVIDLAKDNPPTKEEVMAKGTIRVTSNNRIGVLTYGGTKLSKITDKGKYYEYKQKQFYSSILGSKHGKYGKYNKNSTNYDNVLRWLIDNLNDDSNFPSLYEPSRKRKLLLKRTEVDKNNFKYELRQTLTLGVIAEINLKQSFQDSLHNISLHVAVCAKLLLLQPRVQNYVSDFLHLMRGKEVADANVNTEEEKNRFYDATVTNTVDLVRAQLTKHPDALVYFTDSTTSRFNNDVRSRISVPKEQIQLIPKLTFRDFREDYLADPRGFFLRLLRRPTSREGTYIRQALTAFFGMDFDDEVLDQKVSTTEIARYVTAVYLNAMEDPDFDPFGKKDFTSRDRDFFKTVSWIMGELKGPTHSTRKRIGAQKSIPPSFSVFHKLPKVETTDRKTVILIDDNLNRFNTYEAINANVQSAFNNNVDIIWVIGAGIEERIKLYLT
jgi:hypothetical protein